jgi:hypothetical protein
VLPAGATRTTQIKERNLFPIGQFLLRTFEPLTAGKVEDFRSTAVSLLTGLREAVDGGAVPYHVALQMQDTIRASVNYRLGSSRKSWAF